MTLSAGPAPVRRQGCSYAIGALSGDCTLSRQPRNGYIPVRAYGSFLIANRAQSTTGHCPCTGDDYAPSIRGTCIGPCSGQALGYCLHTSYRLQAPTFRLHFRLALTSRPPAAYTNAPDRAQHEQLTSSDNGGSAPQSTGCCCDGWRLRVDIYRSVGQVQMRVSSHSTHHLGMRPHTQGHLGTPVEHSPTCPLDTCCAAACIGC